MWKNKKVLVIALVAALVVTATIGGVALARTGTASTSQPGALSGVTANATQPKPLLARAAEILGIDQQKLEASVKQAKSEQQLEALKNRLQKLVQAGKITQAQADAYLKWWQSKPDLTLYEQRLREWQKSRPAVPPELKSWQQARPEVPIPGVPGRPFGHGFRGMRQPGGMMRGMGGGPAPLQGTPPQ